MERYKLLGFLALGSAVLGAGELEKLLDRLEVLRKKGLENLNFKFDSSVMSAISWDSEFSWENEFY